MNAKDIFYKTLIISVIVQAVTFVFEMFSLFVKVPSEFTLIRELLILEICVQFIEGLFYVWLVINFAHVADVTPKRYIDWTITTPTMLITLIFYLIYSHHREKNLSLDLDFFGLLSKNASTITYILSLNWLMLLFGYLGEENIIPTTYGVFFGFIPFILYYLIIYLNYVRSPVGFKLFLYFFIFWSFYGVVALFPYYIKNACYNILDLFAKNLFGVLLSYIIITGSY
jgi:hypothetical protein